MNDIERHIQQTTDRLQCIKQHLQSSSSFQNAARELLDWCMDDRAFQPHFEVPLFNCLSVVGRVASQHGFDLDLGYRLLSVCSAHRDKFSVKSAGMLTSWSEELGQNVLQRQQMKRAGGVVCPAAGEHKLREHPPGVYAVNDRQNTKNLLSLPTKFVAGSQWPPTSSSAVPHWDSNVDKMTSLTTHQDDQHDQSVFQQTPPMGQTMMGATMSPYQKQLPGAGQITGVYCTNNNLTATLNGYPPTPTSPGNSQSTPLLSDTIASVETTVAMATTSAGTLATPATSYGGWHRNDGGVGVRAAMPSNSFNSYRPQSRVYHNNADVTYGPQYYAPYGGPFRGSTTSNAPLQRYYPYQPPSRFGVQLHSNAPHDVNTHHQMSVPYQTANPQQYMKCKRAMCPSGMQQPTYGMYRPVGPHASYVGQRAGQFHGQHLPVQQQQQQQQQPQIAGMPMNSSPQARLGIQYGVPDPQHMHGFPNQNGFVNGNGYNQSVEYPGQSSSDFGIFSQHHGQLPGNPTPPITPGSGGSAIYSTLSKPCRNDVIEPSMTFPLPDGVIMPPFRLQHNLAVSNHVFHLDESVYQALACRTDLELQLKCFHHEDREMTTNWPSSVMVSVNANPMSIDVHRPINIKDVCQLTRNTIQITVTACCCSHMFVLQLVHRPTVRSIVSSLLRKQLLLVEQCIGKIKQHCAGVLVSGDGLKVSLKCPLTSLRIRLPARGRECHHLQVLSFSGVVMFFVQTNCFQGSGLWASPTPENLLSKQCFDAESYLQSNSDRNMWHCPVCKKPVTLEDIEINQLLWSVLETLRGSSADSDDVVFDSTLSSWRPMTTAGAPLDDIGGVGKLMSGVAISTMSHPTIETWLTSGCTTDDCIGVGFQEPVSQSPDILSSLAQMGNNLLDPTAAPPNSVVTSSQPCSSIQEPVSSPLALLSSSSSTSDCKPPPVVTTSHQHQQPTTTTDCVSPTSTAVEVSSSDVLVTSSTCLTSSSSCSTEPHSTTTTTENEHVVAGDEEETAFRSDLCLDLLVSDNVIGDPSELLAYLGPTDAMSSFGPGEDLLSLFTAD